MNSSPPDVTDSDSRLQTPHSNYLNAHAEIRSVPSTATSTTDTIGSDDDVHTFYEDLDTPESPSTSPSASNRQEADLQKGDHGRDGCAPADTMIWESGCLDQAESTWQVVSQLSQHIEGSCTSEQALDSQTARLDGECDVPNQQHSCVDGTLEELGTAPPLSQRIQVFIRVRPDSRSDSTSVTISEQQSTIRVQHAHQNGSSVVECTYDHVFGETASQEEVFQKVEPVIHAALQGYNATIFAYGPTGTGKTHTIFGNDNESVPSGELEDDGGPERSGWGVIPRAASYLLKHMSIIREANASIQVDLQCSFMQIYNDRLFDLLADKRRQKPLIIREQPTLDGTTQVVLQGLSSEHFRNLPEALNILQRGRTNRSVRETEGNATSSRSHAIVQFIVTSERALPNGDRLIRKSRLNVVDLAGSEKWNTDVSMEDAHSQELKNINASLSALGNCIAALAEAGRKHIPYRDSMLTRLLQDSFGGNTQASLIATVSPLTRNAEDTIRTLQFADRARSVMQTVHVNETVTGSSELLLAKVQIAKLRERLESEQRRRRRESESIQRDFLEKVQLKDKEIQKLAKENATISRQREEDNKRIRALESRIKDLEISADLQRQSRPISSNNGNGGAPASREERPQKSMKKNGSGKDVRGGGRYSHHDPNRAYQHLIEKYAFGAKPSKKRGLSQTSLKQQRLQPLEFRDQTGESNQADSTQDTEPQSESYEDAQPNYVGKPSSYPVEHTSQHPQQLQKRIPVAHQYSGPQDPSIWMGNAIESAQAQHPNDVNYSIPGNYGMVSHYHQNAQYSSTISSLAAQVTPSEQAIPDAYWRGYPGTRADAAPPTVQSSTNQRWDGAAAINVEYASETKATKQSVGVSDAADVCAKHFLRGCVLCAAAASRPSNPISALPPAMSPGRSQTFAQRANPSSEMLPEKSRSFVLEDPPKQNAPCARHRLTNCFICSKDDQFSSNTAIATRFQSDIPGAIRTGSEQNMYNVPVDGGRGRQTIAPPASDAKCSAHALSNCVLCSGSQTFARKGPIPSPWDSNPSSFIPSHISKPHPGHNEAVRDASSDLTSTWSSTRALPGYDVQPSNPVQSDPLLYQYDSTSYSQPPRRYSFQNTTSESTNLQFQQSVSDTKINSTASMGTTGNSSSNSYNLPSAASRSEYGTTTLPVLGAQPQQNMFPQSMSRYEPDPPPPQQVSMPVIEIATKQHAHPTNNLSPVRRSLPPNLQDKRNFDALIREASAAATFAIRHK